MSDGSVLSVTYHWYLASIPPVNDGDELIPNMAAKKTPPPFNLDPAVSYTGYCLYFILHTKFDPKILKLKYFF